MLNYTEDDVGYLSDLYDGEICYEDSQALAFMDIQPVNAGHVLVVPRAHVADVREADDITGAAIMASVARMARAVARVFPNDGLSVWHSIGPAADQEVPHLHVHLFGGRWTPCVRSG